MRLGHFARHHATYPPGFKHTLQYSSWCRRAHLEDVVVVQDLNDPKRVVRAAQDDQVLVAAPFHCDRVLLRTIGLKRRHMGATACTLEIMGITCL